MRRLRRERLLPLIASVTLERGKLFVGTSGFAYKEWKGDFYPEDLPDKKMLDFYAQKLPSVEINYTFRRLPTESSCLNWKSQCSEAFRITLKAPQRITHWKRLVDVQEEVDEFVRRARLLGDNLGTILFQLPPNFKYERERLESFLASLPPVCRYAMEFRHDSWNDPSVHELLSANSVAICAAETEDHAVTSIPTTARHAYLRLRKEEYSDEELSLWAKRIDEPLTNGVDVFAYFKHEGGGVGPRYALAVKNALA
jgi:uncharacterized protein YecE (DUF72 family)